MPSLLLEYLGSNFKFDEKTWKSYQMNSHGDAAVKALDEFCSKIVDENRSDVLY